MFSSSNYSLLIAFAFVSLCVGASNAQLSTTFYSKSCPHLFPTVSSVIRSALAKEARMGASLLRLFFHDCFVNGCDGSILLDGRTNEKFAAPNFQSARGFEVIDNVKSAVERVCPGVVSCADLLAISARDSVVTLGGPYWNMKVGRRDSRTASQAGANSSIPSPSFGLSQLLSSFGAQGLSVRDMVALSGAHTIGQASCTNIRAHIYNDTNIDASFAQARKVNCPSNSGNGDLNLEPLDLQTPTRFDHDYYKNLMNKKGLLHSDQELFNGVFTDSLVRSYASNPHTFAADFVAAMIKLGDIKPLTGSSGEIRKNCRRAN